MEEASNYSFDAPTYFDFNKHEDNENIDAYFEIDHENDIPDEALLIRPILKTEQLDEICEDVSIITIEDDTDDVFNETFDDQCPDMEVCHLLRKSLSTGDLLPIQTKSNDCRSLSKSSSRSNRLEKLAQPKCATKDQKYVSTAEQMIKFYRTPDRFHTRHKNYEILNKQQYRIPSTIPQSPNLTTKNRHRANANVLSRDEIERQQAEEQKRFKIKANPINYKAMQGPVKPVAIQKKPCTEVRPFNLTEYPTKQVEQEEPLLQQHEFHARPVPKAVYEKPKIDFKTMQNKQILKFSSNENLKIKPARTASLDLKPKPTKLTATEPMPFSFSARDETLSQRRRNLINKVLEEEKRAREFKAKPVPKYASKKSSSLTSLKSNASKTEENKRDNTNTFRAKTPTVLYQKPFEPKKSDRALTEVTEFCLNTDRRVKDREDFDKKNKDKLDRMNAVAQQMKREKLQLEEEEISRMRKEAVHIAQPIRKYKELKVVPTMKVTVPMSPSFQAVNRRGSVKNKEN